MPGEKKGYLTREEQEVQPHTQQASHSDAPETQPESGAGPEVRENQMPGNIDRDPRDDI